MRLEYTIGSQSNRPNGVFVRTGVPSEGLQKDAIHSSVLGTIINFV